MRVGQYTKAIVMILAAGLGIFTAASTDGVVSPVEYVNIGLGILAAILVYLLPNLTTGPAKYTKSIVGFATAALTALAVVVAQASDWSGVTSNDWLGVLLAGLAAVGLFILPNTKAAEPVVLVSNNFASPDIEGSAVADGEHR